ncbi:MAG: hypothetical protein ACRDJG_04945, partial [Actinomycetota bacterium]
MPAKQGSASRPPKVRGRATGGRPTAGSWKKKKPDQVDSPVTRMRAKAKAQAKKGREEHVHDFVAAGLFLAAVLAGLGLFRAGGPVGEGL